MWATHVCAISVLVSSKTNLQVIETIWDTLYANRNFVQYSYGKYFKISIKLVHSRIFYLIPIAKCSYCEVPMWVAQFLCYIQNTSSSNWGTNGTPWYKWKLRTAMASISKLYQTCFLKDIYLMIFYSCYSYIDS